NVSVVDVIVVKELEKVLTQTPEVAPEVVKTVEELKKETIDQFIETSTHLTSTEKNTSAEISTNALEILEPVPQIIAGLIDLKDEVSPAVDAKITAAIEVQVQNVQE